jgi:hypothetical protein
MSARHKKTTKSNKKDSWWKRLRLFVLEAILLIILLLSIWPLPVDWLVDTLLEKQSPGIKQNLQWEQSRFSLFQGLSLRKVKVSINPQIKRNPKKQKAIQLSSDKVIVNIDWFKLIQGNIHIEDLQIEKAHIKLGSQPLQYVQKYGVAAPLGAMYLLRHLIKDSFQISIDELEFKQSPWYAKGLELQFTKLKPQSREASLQAKLKEGLFLEPYPLKNLSIKGSINRHSINLEQMQCELDNGNIKASGIIPHNPRQKAQIKFSSDYLRVSPKLLPFLPNDQSFHAQAKISGNISGPLFNIPLWKGTANIKLRSIRIEDFPFQDDPFVKDFFPGLNPLEFEHAELNQLKLQKSRISVQAIRAVSPDFNIQGEGWLHLDGKLHFNIQGKVSQKRLEELPWITKVALKEEKGGGFALELDGSLEKQSIKPKGAFIRKATSNTLTEIGNSLLRIFQ